MLGLGRWFCLCSGSGHHQTYFLLQDAIWTLNTLQSNASVLQQARSGQRDPRQQLLVMPGFLERAGLTVGPPEPEPEPEPALLLQADPLCAFQVEQLDHLNIIHITGTKGKVRLLKGRYADLIQAPGTRVRPLTPAALTPAALTPATLTPATLTSDPSHSVFQGSTCAFTERILRTYGFRTGFYR